MREGYIKLHRQITEWGWYSDPVTKAVFLHLLLSANYKTSEYRGKIIMPGQLVTSRNKIAQECGITERQARTALKHLKSTGEVTIDVTNKYTVITVENWSRYQVEECETDQQNVQQCDQQVTSKRPASDQQTERKERRKRKEAKEKEESKERVQEGKKERNIYNIPPAREEVMAYCMERGNSVNVDAFMDFYDSKGWYVGKNKMKDWRAAVRNWERHEKPSKPRQADWMDL